MKRIAWIGLVGIAFAGCSSMPAQEGGWRSNLDLQKIHAVEQAATQTGVRVYWINPPMKKESAQKPT